MNKLNRFAVLTAAYIPVMIGVAAASAQTSGGKGAGLDALDEQKVMGDLASYKLTTLLDRDFDLFKIPPEERSQVMTFIKLQQLVNGNNLGIAGRRALAVDVAKGFDGLLPKLDDASKLFEYSNQLFTSGVVPTVTELEYFGENPLAQTQLKPAAETVKKMYAQTSTLAKTQVDVIANGIKNVAGLNAVRPKLLAMRNLSSFGEYCNHMATYSLCMGLPADDPKRKSLAEDSIKFLSTFDNDKSGVQAQVRVMIGKLQLVAGEYAESQKTFDGIIQNGGQMKPPPEGFQQNDSRYFRVVAEISSRNLQGGEKDIPDLETWQTRSYLPNLDASGKQEVQATMSMLKFRLYSAKSDLTNDETEKKKTNDQAIDTLADLLKQQPTLKELVFDQLIGRIPANPDYASLNPLVLQAIQQEGFAEVIKKDGDPFDKAKLNKAIPAAQELVNRRGKGVDDSTAALSAYFIPYAYSKLDDKKKAAGAYMDFAEKFPNEKTRAGDCMDHAEALVGELRKADRDDDETRKLYDRFLPLAINPPYNEKRFAYGYARLLYQEKDFIKAIQYFKQVEDKDKNYAEAQYFQLLAMSQALNDPKLSADDHKQMVTDILNSAAKIDDLFKSAPDEASKKEYLEWVVVADQIAADQSRQSLKDPARSLQILDGFEDRIKGAKDEKAADLNVMRLRVTDYLALKKVDDATQTLAKVLKVDPAAGLALLGDVLKAVGHEKDQAQIAGNTAEVKTLAADQAILSGFMLDSVEKDPKLTARVPEFRLYDANSKREAAELVDDPAARKTGLEAALKQYEMLHSQNLDVGTDTAALQGIGLTQYDLGNYAGAFKALQPLVDGKKVGNPMEDVVENGVSVTRENTAYWEANYKYYNAALEIFKANPQDKAALDIAQVARRQVVNRFIIFGDKTGGAKYHDDFVKLKDEMGKVLPATAAPVKPVTPAAAPKK